MLTREHFEAGRECSPGFPVHWVVVVVGLELRGHHFVGTRRLIMEIQSRVPVVGHVGLHAMCVTGGLLGCRKVKGRREGVSTEYVVDMIARILARRYDGVEALIDKRRSMIQDEVGAMEVVRNSVTQDSKKAQKGRVLEGSSHVDWKKLDLRS